jgi:hypothetical protein
MISISARCDCPVTPLVLPRGNRPEDGAVIRAREVRYEAKTLLGGLIDISKFDRTDRRLVRSVYMTRITNASTPARRGGTISKDSAQGLAEFGATPLDN